MKLRIIASVLVIVAVPIASFTSPLLKTDARTTRRTSHPPELPQTASSSTILCNRNQRRRSLSQLSCICINCALVTNCTAYHFVEEKHEQPHLTANPTFTPRQGSPTIHVNIRPPKTDLTDVWQEHESETERAVAKGSEHGDTVYDLKPQTTIEYDVVKCADFQLDEGCWVRNMPEEIKRANPDFVPT